MALAEDAKRVLVIEDDADIRGSLAELLESEGYSVTSAANGHQGLERAREQAFHLILLDLMMPVMNGWEFREAQKRNPSIANVPVVVVSAASRTAIDASEIIAKPFSIGDLLDAVQRHARAA